MLPESSPLYIMSANPRGLDASPPAPPAEGGGNRTSVAALRVLFTTLVPWPEIDPRVPKLSNKHKVPQRRAVAGFVAFQVEVFFWI